MYGYDFRSILQYRMDMRVCRDRLREGSHSFHAASLLIPSEYRSPMTALYAFCRDADDAIDANPDPGQGLDDLHRRLSAIYAGTPRDHAVDRAFTDVVERFDIPFALPAALLEGFEWDVTGRRYETTSDVYAYSARVAGTVGAMMALIMGVRDRDVLARACALGVAMQITNICRDVGEDAARGRVYLPEDLLRCHAVDARKWLEKPVLNESIIEVIEILLEVADRLYLQSEWGISQLPARCRPGIFAARSIYAEIGSEIRRSGFDPVSYRAYVKSRRKLQLLAQSMRKSIAQGIAHGIANRPRDRAPILEENRFLIDAVSPAAN